MEDDLCCLAVVDGEGCSPIAVPRLADGSWVDEVACARRNGHGPRFGVVAGLVARANVLPVMVFLRESSLDVGVTEESDVGGHLLEGCPGVAHVEDVVVFVERGAVGAGDSGLFGLEGALGYCSEPV